MGGEYVGCSMDYDARKHRHMSELKLGIHPNPLLQEDYNVLGKDSFEFEVMVVADPDLTKEDLLDIEERFINRLQPEYNIVFRGAKLDRKNYTKLTAEQIPEIRAKYIMNEYGYNKISKEYGVSAMCIRDIITGRTWKDV